MKRNLQSFLIILCFLTSLATSAQDVHFSQIHASPTLLNPAMTGLFIGDMRFIANTKSQWQNITNGYKSVAGSMDMKLAEMSNGDIVGGGLQLLADRAGDLDFKTNSVGLNFAYLKSIDKGKNFISFGLQNAFVSNSVDYSKIIAFDDEPAIRNGANDQLSYWDISAGIGWFHNFSDDYAFNVGVSLSHINKPYISFFKDDYNDADVYLFRKLVIHGTGDLKLSKKSVLKPSFLYASQGPHKETTVGSFWKYRASKDRRQRKPTSIYFGAWLRSNISKNNFGADAIIAAVRVDIQNTFMTFTFDVTVSSLNKVTYGNGGPEFSIVQVIDFKNKKRKPAKVECPAFLY
jgi:type IX secretion system PorP/SprF family membrane protein